MNLIITLDDNGGMTFNGRRQSRDKALLADIARDVSASHLPLLATHFSEKLLAEADIPCEIFADAAERAANGQYCLLENTELSPFIERAERLIVYRWNRKYPCDRKIDIDIDLLFALESSCDFVGNAHEKITKTVYVKR